MSRTDIIKNILIKYNLYNRSLTQYHNNIICSDKFDKRLRVLIAKRHTNFTILPLFSRNVAHNYTEIFTKINQLQSLPFCPSQISYANFRFLMIKICQNEHLKDLFYDILMFLLILSDKELSLLGFKQSPTLV